MANLTRRKKSGIALILTLSIMILLSLTVTQIFKENAEEIRLLKNEDTRFQMEMAEWSILSTFIRQLTTPEIGGANNIYWFIRLGGGTIPLTEEAQVEKVRLWSMDHYLNVNQRTSDITKENHDRFLMNTFDTYTKGIDNQQSYYTQILGQLQDFIDIGEEITTGGAETYPNLSPAISVKNRGLDFLSEMNLLPAFQEVKLVKHSSDFSRLPLRATESNQNELCEPGKLNLNMVPANDEEEWKQFFSDYIKLFLDIQNEDNCSYQSIVDQQEEIETLVYQKFGELTLDSLLSGADFFNLPLREEAKWKLIEENTDLLNFFESRSNFIGLSYQVRIGEVTQTIEVHMELKYEKDNTDVPNDVSIIYYKIR